MPPAVKAPAETVDLSGDGFDISISATKTLKRVITSARFGVHLKQIDSTT
jgi:hypothetical protein